MQNWAQLTNRPNNGSQRYDNTNNNNNHNSNYNNNNNNNNYHQNKSNNNRRTINNLNYSNKYKGYQNRNHNNGPRNQYYLTQQNNNNSRNTRNVGITSGKRRHNDVNYVILDAGAFIGRQSFFNNFNPNTVYYMTPAVQNEIRDKQSRQFLERFPYEIKVRKPDQESVQFVNTYLQKNPNLKNLSKVDRQIIALAHTLEREYHGTGHLSQSKYPKAMTVIGGATGRDGGKDKNKKPVKKSKTGRIHTEAKPIKDTGVRLAMFKKVIPFHFDDFMTLSQAKYGEKYGKPTPNEWMAHSPVRAKQANVMEDELKENKMNLDENKDNAKSKEKAEKKESPVKYNPNIKAMTEAPVKDKNENDVPSPISKSRRRKERKKRANQAKQDKIAEKSALTEETLLAFQIQEDKDEDSDDDDGDMMKEITLDDIDKLKKDIEQQKLKENQLDETKSNAESEKSEIEKMIEEDLTTTFNETASLISSLSEQSTQQFKQASQMQYRLDLNVNKQYNSAPAGAPRISQSQSLPANADADSIAFGTLFQGTTGSLFPSSAVVSNSSAPGQLAAALSNSPLPPIDQNHASNPMPVSPYQQPLPQPHPPVHTQAQPRQGQQQQQQQQQQPQQEQIRPQPIRPQPQQKITINEAWQGDWLGENNYKPVPKNDAKRKKAKLKNVQDSSNEDSSVALITVDQTMQKAMIGMGLRVLTTSADRQYGNNRNGKKGGRYNNGEPVDLKFRCFSCYNMENDTTRITCRYCGNQTFQRVQIYQDENGRYHDRYSYVDRYTTRYKKGIVPYASGTKKINQQNMANSQPNNRRNNNKKKNKYNQRKNNQSVGGGGGGGRYRGGWRQM